MCKHTHTPTYTPTHPHTHTHTHTRTHAPTHPRTHVPTHPHTHTPTHPHTHTHTVGCRSKKEAKSLYRLLGHDLFWLIWQPPGWHLQLICLRPIACFSSHMKIQDVERALPPTHALCWWQHSLQDPHSHRCSQPISMLSCLGYWNFCQVWINDKDTGWNLTMLAIITGNDNVYTWPYEFWDLLKYEMNHIWVLYICIPHLTSGVEYWMLLLK